MGSVMTGSKVGSGGILSDEFGGNVVIVLRLPVTREQTRPGGSLMVRLYISLGVLNAAFQGILCRRTMV